MDITFGIKFMETPNLVQRFGFWLINLGCLILGFEVKNGNRN